MKRASEILTKSGGPKVPATVLSARPRKVERKGRNGGGHGRGDGPPPDDLGALLTALQMKSLEST